MKKILPLLLLSTFIAPLSTFGQGTAFTYQGVLSQGGAPANGAHDLTFTLYSAASGGGTVGTSNIFNDLPVSNGLFTVTLDFGASAFIGFDRWLQIAVRPGASTGAYTNLAPRQPITATPYAMFAGGVNSAGIIGQIGDAQLATTLTFARTFSNPGNQFFGNGANLTSLNASQLASGTVPAAALSNAWKLGGNSGTTPGTHFLGTMDNQALEFRVNNQRGLRLEYANDGAFEGVNLIGGYGGNFISGGAVGATIAGGGRSDSLNQVNGDFGTVGGGNLNTASDLATVGGGRDNTANSVATVGGGIANRASGNFSTIGGGGGNRAGGNSATVPGGSGNFASGDFSFAAGTSAMANHSGTFVWADAVGGILGPSFGSTGTNQFLIRASGGVAIGTNDPAGAALRVAGAIKADSFLGMGATLMVGTTDNQPLEFKVNNQRGLRLEFANDGFNTAVNVIGGASGNFVPGSAVGATIAGGGGFGAGESNKVSADFGTVGGGQGNTADNLYATVGGGLNNTAAGDGSVVGGGLNNQTTGFNAAIPGGRDNTAHNYAFAAGRQAKANHEGAFVWADASGVDFASTANNQFLIRAAGGVGIGTATPDSLLQIKNSGNEGAAIRIGGNSTALMEKKIRFGDGDFVTIGECSTADDVMKIVASRVGIGREASVNKLEVEGDASKTTAGGWLANSDARIKKAVQPVTGALDKLSQVRLVSFRYTDDYRQFHASVEDRPYLNVVAQEFRQVFPEHVKSSGEKLPDGSEILQVDTYPLTIYSAAAVQELNGQVKALQGEMKRRDAENAELKQRLEKLERLLTRQNGGAR